MESEIEEEILFLGDCSPPTSYRDDSYDKFFFSAEDPFPLVDAPSIYEQFTFAIETGDYDKCQGLLREDLSPSDLNSLLSIASRRGKTEIVKSLLDSGANPNINSRDIPPLVLAAEVGHFDTVNTLINGGANEDGHICYALVRAYSAGHFQICEYLLKFVSDEAYYLYSSEESLIRGYPDWDLLSQLVSNLRHETDRT